MKTIGIPLLRTIIAFADTGRTQAAADAVNKTQAAISVHFKRLEEITGKTLFTKKGRHLELNTDGQKLVSYARQIIRIHNDALASFNDTAFTGTVRVGLPDDYISFLLEPFLVAFEKALPRAQLDLHCAPSADLRLMQGKGKLDVAIVSCGTNTEEGYVLTEETSHWVANQSYQHDPSNPVKLLLFPAGCILRKWALNALHQQKMPYQIVCTSHNMQALKTATQQGLGVMVATKSNIPPDSQQLSPEMGFPALPNVTILLVAGSAIDPAIIAGLYQAMR